MLRLKYILLFILLQATLFVAGQGYVIDKVCIGAERYYRIDGEANSTYTWNLKHPDGSNEVLPSNSDTVMIIWPMYSGIYELSAVQHGANGCDAEIELGDVEVFDLPEIFAGPTINLCVSAPVYLVGSSAIHYQSLLWTSSGDGTYDNDTLLHPTYYPGAQDLLTGSVVLTLSAEGLGYPGSCPSPTSDVMITFGSMTVDELVVNVSCYQFTDGSVQLTATGGVVSYTYTLNSVSNDTGWFPNLAAGSYNYTVTDLVGCQLFGSIMILQPEMLTAEISWQDETMPGANDGSITIFNPQGGSGIYEFSIDNTSTWHTSGIFTNLAPGYYEVFIRDAQNTDCFISLTIITILPADALSAVVDFTNITCFGASDGSIAITNPQGGSGNYEYSINGGTTWLPTNVFTGLSMGTYIVMIRDANMPEVTTTLATIVITQPAQLTANVTWTNETFPGANDGSITVSNASGGTGNYEYSINGINWSASGSFINLAPGSYTVFIRDANVVDCFITLTTVVILPGTSITAQVNSTNVTCFGGNDGSISITNPQGGSGTYQYSINGGTTWLPTNVFTGLSMGTYIVMIRDANLPAVSFTLATIVITQPAQLAANVTWTNETFPGANDGTITISSPTGGSGSYQYSINGINWSASGSFINLAPGSYTLFIRDANVVDCFITLSTVVILPGTSITAQVIATNVTCFGGNDGSISITNPQGGSGNYQYSINGGTTWLPTNVFTGLSIGTYIVMIRDANLPAVSFTLATIVITQPAQLAANVTWTNETFPGASDGTITISSPTGGSGSYQYSINGINWSASGSFINLAPGSYTVFIRDANVVDCFITLSTVVILPGTSITADVNAIEITCFGGNDGSISITNPQGGSGSYEYSINNGMTWQANGLFNNLTSGSYQVMIRDSNFTSNMTFLAMIRLTEPALLSAFAEATGITCYGMADGLILFNSPAGGSGYYEFSIDNATTWQTDLLFTNLPAGVYHAWVRDAQHPDCKEFIANIEITQPPVIFIRNVSHADATCNDSNGAINIFAVGGTGNLQYSIDNGTNWFSTSFFANLPAGTYQVKVIDDNGCEITHPHAIVVNALSTPQIDNIITTNAIDGQPVGTALISVTGGTLPYEFSLQGGPGWQTDNLFTGLAAGSYVVLVRDANGCIAQSAFSIHNIAQGAVEVVAGHISACMDQLLEIPLLAYGFIDIYSFRLTLIYNPDIIQYNMLNQINSGLSNGNIAVDNTQPGILYITYSASTASTVQPETILLYLEFIGKQHGWTDLGWELTDCVFRASNGYPIPTIYVNGSARVYPVPNVQIFGDGNYCEGDELTIQAVSQESDSTYYIWRGPNGTTYTGANWPLGTLNTSHSGIYELTATNADNCSIELILNIKVNALPEIQLSDADTLCVEKPELLTPGTGYTAYLWHDGSTHSHFLADKEGEYWVEVVDKNGCLGIASIIMVPCDFEVLMPNAFSPNGDGLNDTFNPVFGDVEVQNYSITIFNKWGQLLYTGYDKDNGWDGRYKGVIVPGDVYAYVMNYQLPQYFMKRAPQVIRGSVTVVR